MPGPLQPGSEFGPYRIVERAGRGGMATVYKAYQAALSRYVAIKILPDYLADDGDFAERFKREAVAVASLRHPNIPAVFDYGQLDDRAYIITEYIDGGTLTEQLGVPLPLHYTAGILSQVASALDYAHARGLLHRDVKPANILLARDGRPILNDFGLAKMMGAEMQLSTAGQIMGTPLYMSPEQCAGEVVTPASDQYAVAVIAYQMLTGRLPFDAATPAAVIHAQIHDPLPPPRLVNPQLPAEAEMVLLKGLAKAAADRYPTCFGFTEALSRVPAAQAAAVVPPPSPPQAPSPEPAPALPMSTGVVTRVLPAAAPAEPGSQAATAGPAYTVSPDGRHYWDGAAWQPLLPASLAVPTPGQAEPASPTVTPGPAHTVSPDGRYYWDGAAWQPLLPTSLAVPTPGQAEYSARFYLGPVRVAMLFLVGGPFYSLWWIWRLYHHVKHEQLPRSHSFWTILVPLYNLKTLADQFKTVHEEGSRALGRAPFALQGVYIIWLLGLVFSGIADFSRGPAVALWLLISYSLSAIWAYLVQGGANRYLAFRLHGRSKQGFSAGEVVAATVGGLLTLLTFVGAFLQASANA